MAAKNNISIEEKIEDLCKHELYGGYYTKTRSISPEIHDALCKAPSKSGGNGRNYPDIQLLLDSTHINRIPVMIEVKGKQGLLIKKDNETGEILNVKANGEPNYSNISKYAVNGAVHYANAVLKYTDSYDAAIAVGVNGFSNPDGSLKIQIQAYYISKSNLFVPKLIADDYQDLSFLRIENSEALAKRIELLHLTESEAENRKLELEDEMERNLKAMNNKMRVELQIMDIDSRVRLIAGMVMAGLGVKDESGLTYIVRPLQLSELRGEPGEYSNDGIIIMNRIRDFLQARKVPHEKIDMIANELTKAFIYSKLQDANNGISILHTLYSDVQM